MAPRSELPRQSTLALALIARSFWQPATVNTAADQAQAPAAGRGQGPGGRGGAKGAAPVNPNAVAGGELFIEPPTLINLGFERFVEGDDSRNATVAVSYRRTGEPAWKQALPLLNPLVSIDRLGRLKGCGLDQNQVFERSRRRLRTCVDPMPNRSALHEDDGVMPVGVVRPTSHRPRAVDPASIRHRT